jgi:nucleotide-binding universal stress UspA family protein
MTRILIPFTDPDQGERAIRRLLEEKRAASVEVELLAVVEPLTPGKVSIFLSQERAGELAGAAAARWLEQLEPLLTAARIRHRSQIVLGVPKKVIAEAMRREDIDRVLLPMSAARWLGGTLVNRRAAQLSRATPHPVTVVS